MYRKDKSADLALTSYELLKVSSLAFSHKKFIPYRYTCDGSNVNPPILIEHIPEHTKDLALIMEDMDNFSGRWVVWNIPVPTNQTSFLIEENTIPGVQGLTDFGTSNYSGPCCSKAIHRYIFTLYALDKKLDLPPSTTKDQLEIAIQPHIIGLGELIGVYQRNMWAK
ncbi:YbhB/YbcL family Raf kinase inhibitor-like protein [Xanthocytophaga agilis]|uniref:YbhB/YbcL family Raf kinase inhibitor-like protein n=1 Tax=Xanthocytophaga agilis TaxID=3048010 RepID=A0AAE3RD95_9BACT|nr:YbhB/YbcL family Raf kinase inhibitor-like protein [Xanthocytophaga agilis]MDJ1506454.1 YbhB/YbcL family Raf kinase inhibitor-like protein [Xanthocytophaga agilis]